jgi:hypothetical protein
VEAMHIEVLIVDEKAFAHSSVSIVKGMDIKSEKK